MPELPSFGDPSDARPEKKGDRHGGLRVAIVGELVKRGETTHQGGPWAALMRYRLPLGDGAQSAGRATSERVSSRASTSATRTGSPSL